MSVGHADMSDSLSDIEQETNIDDVDTDDVEVEITSQTPLRPVSEEEVRSNSPFVPTEEETQPTLESSRLPSYSAAQKSQGVRLPPLQPPSYHQAVLQLGEQDVELQELNAAEHRGTRPLPPSYNIAVSRAAAGISTPSRAAACTSTPSRAAACTSTPVDTAALTEEETRFSKVDPGTAGAAEPPPNYEHIAEDEQVDEDTTSTGEDAEQGSSGRTSVDHDSSTGLRFMRAIRRLRERGSLQDSTKKKIIIVCVVVSLVVLFVALFPFQFSYVEYHQFALVRRKSTGRVASDRVYQHGCYVLGADREFIYFDRSVHVVEFTNLGMFTKDNVDVAINVEVLYFLRYESIGKLWEDYAGNYSHVIEAAVKTTIRNYGPYLSQDDYLLRREHVEEAIHETLKLKFSGWGINIYLFNYQNLHLPTRILEKKLQLLVIKTEIEKEHSYQRQREIELQTELLTTSTRYKAKEAINNGTAQASAIRTIAETEKFQHVELAHSNAFRSMMETLNVTQMDHALSFYYLAMLDTIDHFAGSFEFSKRGLYTPKGI